jgi:uncharacterized protein with gpF-like domain
MQPYDSSGGSLPPDAQHAFGTAAQSLWDDQIDQLVMQRIRNTIKEPWNSTMSAAPETVSRSFDLDPNIVDYLQSARNRLRNFPNELYALIQRLVARGLDRGNSVQDVAEEIRKVLQATGNDTYRNRAITVARTETIGATNAGSFAAAQALADVTGDPAPEKIWLATDDTRTRPTHNLADGQRVPLMQPFIVGGFPLQFPGDPSGPPGEVINCRCTILNVTRGEELDWTDRQYRQNADDLWADYDLETGDGS